MSRFAVEDYLHPFKNLYRTSPRWVKSSIGWAYSKVPLYIRYGSELTNATNLLAQSQWWDVDTLQSYQWEQMQQLLHHAYNHVPYYRRIWQNAGVAPEDIRNLDDVANLPLLTKGDVRDHKEELVAENYRDRLLPFNSGGSTGTPLEFYWERGRTRSLERAFMWRQWSWANFEYGERTAILRGQTIKEGVHYDPVDNALFLSGFNLSDARAVEYLQALRAFKPASIQAYPATITLLANYMKRASEPPIAGLKVLLCGSENLYPAQRQLLENVFQCRVYSWYGHGESVCLAGGCEESNQYHVYGEYGYIELIDKSNQVMDWIPGTRGEIVGTGFNNWAMPLIRYRSADIAIIGAEKCSCGRPYPLWERIEGRKQEYIIAKDGKLIALTSFIFGQHYHAFDKIKRMQLIQDRPGEILVRLIVVDAWSNEDQAEFRNQMIQALDDHSWQIDYEYVNDIPLTARGKHRFVIQNIPLAGMWDGERY